MSDGWDWALTDRALRDLRSLDGYSQERITSKLDAIVADEWREPTESREPFEGAPHQKLAIGPFRLGVRADQQAQVRSVHRVAKRGGDAYRGDDE